MRNMTAVALIIGFVQLASAGDPVKTVGGPVTERGETIWKAKCASCHEKPAMAKIINVAPEKLDLKNLDPKTPRQDLVKAVTDGKDKMKGFKGKLKADDINAVVDYVEKTFLKNR